MIHGEKQIWKNGIVLKVNFYSENSWRWSWNSSAGEITGSGSNGGYCRVWVSLQRKGMIARREDVPQLLLRLDAQGVERRKSWKHRRRIYRTSGLSYVWHIDEFDKIKPYGFSIHWSIDGYSRRIIWLEASESNKYPDMIANYYLKAAKNLNRIPKIMKEVKEQNILLFNPFILLREIYQIKVIHFWLPHLPWIKE